MGRVGEKLDVDFVVSTGDNFYDTGLTGMTKSFFYSDMQIFLYLSWYYPNCTQKV
jgi:tartrate-resistant acid phosphatase type 5